MNELQIENICGVDCYEKDGTAYLKLEDVARGLDITKRIKRMELNISGLIGRLFKSGCILSEF